MRLGEAWKINNGRTCSSSAAQSYDFSSILRARDASGVREGEENKGFEWMFYFL
jgi:hypothetical protein